MNLTIKIISLIITFQATSFLCCSSTFAVDIRIYEFTNSTGMSASDLHVEFAGTGGNLTTMLLQSPVGCPEDPMISPTGSPMVIDWGVACIPNGGKVIVKVKTENGPIQFDFGYWTSPGNQGEGGIGTINPNDIVETTFDSSWDWTGHKRNLTYAIHPTLFECPVFEDTNLGDAFIDAANIWNAQMTGWVFNLKPWEDENGDGCDNYANISVVKDNTDVNISQGENTADIDALALFQRIQNDNMGETITAKIRVKDEVDLWGLNFNPDFFDPETFDPIIVFLHELGHAMRLNHVLGVAPDAQEGSIMRERLSRNLHNVNPLIPPPLPFQNAERLPSEGDKFGAMASAEFKAWPPEDIPTLSQWSLIILALLTLIIGIVSIKQGQINLAKNGE